MSDWISVEDRLPDRECECLVFANNRVSIANVVEDWVDDKPVLRLWCEWVNDEDITHWMPLPESPKGDNK